MLRLTVSGVWLALAVGSRGFAPPTMFAPPRVIATSPIRTDTVLFGREDDTVELVAASKKKSGLEEGVRSKLVAESIAPWRTLRLFLYFSLGSGAAVGGIITLTGVAAALSGARAELDLNTEYLNLAIDFGAVAVFALLAKFDLDKQAELAENVEKKIEEKKAQKTVVKGMREREKKLSELMLEIQVSADGKTQQAPVSSIQSGAKQHVIIVAGPRKACKDALIGANLLKMDFAMSNILVVPYEIGVDRAELQSRPSGGFGDRPFYENQPYIARVAGDGWEEYIQQELDDAVKQASGENVAQEGIAIIIANNGKVIRRGVGKVPWRQMVDQLEEAVKLS